MELIRMIGFILIETRLGMLLGSALALAGATKLVTWLIMPRCPGCNKPMESTHIDYNGEMLFICKKCHKDVWRAYGDKTS